MLSSRYRLMIRQPLICALVFCLLFIHDSNAEEVEQIQYITEQDRSVQGILTPDPAPGVVPTSNNDYVKFRIDDKESGVSLSGSGGGQASVSKQLPSIAEGRHSAILSTLKTDLGVKDSKQLLFIYDTIPPELEVVFPETSRISSNNISFIIEYSDEGSGFPALKEDLELTATINGIDAYVKTVRKDNKSFLLIDFDGTEGPQDGKNYSLNIKLKDRAGNEATLSKTFSTPEDISEIEEARLICEDDEENKTWYYTVTSRENKSFPILSRLAAVYFTRDVRKRVIEISVGHIDSDDVQLADMISVTSSHPVVQVKRLTGSRSKARFEITQTEEVSPDVGREGVKSLSLTNAVWQSSFRHGQTTSVKDKDLTPSPGRPLALV